MEQELPENHVLIKTPWPCKVCGKEPFFTVWYVGDENPLNIETRICDKCYSKLDFKPRREQPKEWTRPSEDEWAQWLATGDAEFIEYG